MMLPQPCQLFSWGVSEFRVLNINPNHPFKMFICKRLWRQCNICNSILYHVCLSHETLTQGKNTSLRGILLQSAAFMSYSVSLRGLFSKFKKISFVAAHILLQNWSKFLNRQKYTKKNSREKMFWVEGLFVVEEQLQAECSTGPVRRKFFFCPTYESEAPCGYGREIIIWQAQQRSDMSIRTGEGRGSVAHKDTGNDRKRKRFNP